MKENGNKTIIIIFILMAITLIATILYAKMKPKTTNESDSIKKNTEESIINQPKEEKKYINYTKSDIEIKDKGTLSLNITDDVFTMKLNNKELRLTGIDEQIKKFTYDSEAFIENRNSNGIFILLLSKTNNIYAGFYEVNDVAIKFKKINTNLEIKDITINEILSNNSSSIKASVVLDNNEIRPIIENKDIYIISNKDTSKYEQVLDNLVIYKDGTISTRNDLNTKLQYKNQNMIVNKILALKPTTDNQTKCYYIITNNRLFKLCGQSINNTNPTRFNNIELVNDKVIIKTTNLMNGYVSNEIDYEITYDDNTNERFKIIQAYIR